MELKIAIYKVFFLHIFHFIACMYNLKYSLYKVVRPELLIDPNSMLKIFNALNYCRCKMFTPEDKIFQVLCYIVITKYSYFIITIRKLVLVLTCLGGRFGINCLSAVLKFSKFLKITGVIYPKNRPKQNVITG